MSHFKSAPLFGALAVTLLMALCGAASAATITYSDSISNQQTDIDDVLPVSQFNPALGTLVSAQVTLTDDTNIFFSLLNSTNTDITTDSLRLHPVDITVDLTGPVGLDASGLISINQTIAQEYKNELIPANSSWSTPLFDGPGSAAGTFTDPTDLATYFIGTGSVNTYEAVSVTSSTTSITGATGQSSTGLASAEVSITYTYIPAPEPSSVVLFGLGTMGLIWAAIRRRQK